MPFRKITIRTNILSNFLIIIAAVALLLIGAQYYFSKKIAQDAIERTFLQTSEKVALSVQQIDLRIKGILYKTINQIHLNGSTTDLTSQFKTKLFTDILLRHTNIYSVYVCSPSGNFFEIINMVVTPMLYQHYRAPAEARWTVIQITSAPSGKIREFTFLDKSLQVISKRHEHTDFLANKRSWYQEAVKSDNVVRSDPYLFKHLEAYGITFSKKIDGKDSVVAIDFTMPALQTILADHKFSPTSQLFLFGRNGSVICSSEDAHTQSSLHIAEILKTGEIDQVVFSHTGDKEYFVMITPLSNEFGVETYLGISVSTAEMLQPYIQKIFYSLGLALLLLLLLIPLVINTISRIVKPINKLMIENSKIKNRKFNNVEQVDTNIIELMALSRSQVLMSKSIQDYQEHQKNLMNSFIKLIASAIDKKSSYTGAHCKRVPVIAIMLAKEADKSDSTIFKNFHFTDQEQWDEFERGAWLHDCGKITTPEYVVNKATKLETIYNRIHEIRSRFEILWRDIEIAYLEKLSKGEDKAQLDNWRDHEQQQLVKDFAFIADCNQGDNFMTSKKKEQLKTIAQRQWVRHFDNRIGLSQEEINRCEKAANTSQSAVENLLSDRAEHLIDRINFDKESYRAEGFKLEPPEYAYNFGEIYNLMIEKGTLTVEERYKINEHAIMTLKMLNQLPFTHDMEKIPEIAGNHHEMLNGKGYPRCLTKQQLSIPARIIAIADIFEALTATDRPYKKTKSLSETLKIMSFMVKDEHIDSDIFALFLRSGIYLKYAKDHLQEEQIDDVEIDSLLVDG